MFVSRCCSPVLSCPQVQGPVSRFPRFRVLSVSVALLCRSPSSTYPESSCPPSLSERVKEVKSIDPLERGNGRSILEPLTLLSFLPAGSLLASLSNRRHPNIPRRKPRLGESLPTRRALIAVLKIPLVAKPLLLARPRRNLIDNRGRRHLPPARSVKAAVADGESRRRQNGVEALGIISVEVSERRPQAAPGVVADAPEAADAAAHGLAHQALAGEGVQQAVDPAAAGQQGADNALRRRAQVVALVGHAPHAGGAERQGQQDVDEGVEHHEFGDAVDGLDGGLVGEVVAGAALVGEQRGGLAAQLDEGDQVGGDQAELAEEEPDVVQAQA